MSTAGEGGGVGLELGIYSGPGECLVTLFVLRTTVRAYAHNIAWHYGADEASEKS